MKAAKTVKKHLSGTPEMIKKLALLSTTLAIVTIAGVRQTATPAGCS